MEGKENIEQQQLPPVEASIPSTPHKDDAQTILRQKLEAYKLAKQQQKEQKVPSTPSSTRKIAKTITFAQPSQKIELKKPSSAPTPIRNSNYITSTIGRTPRPNAKIQKPAKMLHELNLKSPLVSKTPKKFEVFTPMKATPLKTTTTPSTLKKLEFKTPAKTVFKTPMKEPSTPAAIEFGKTPLRNTSATPIMSASKNIVSKEAMLDEWNEEMSKKALPCVVSDTRRETMQRRLSSFLSTITKNIVHEVVAKNVSASIDMLQNGKIEDAKKLLEETSNIHSADIHKTSYYWVCRAHIEEMKGNYDAVIKLYQEALQIGAEPKSELELEYQAFLLERLRADNNMEFQKVMQYMLFQQQLSFANNNSTIEVMPTPKVTRASQVHTFMTPRQEESIQALAAWFASPAVLKTPRPRKSGITGSVQKLDTLVKEIEEEINEKIIEESPEKVEQNDEIMQDSTESVELKEQNADLVVDGCRFQDELFVVPTPEEETNFHLELTVENANGIEESVLGTSFIITPKKVIGQASEELLNQQQQLIEEYSQHITELAAEEEQQFLQDEQVVENTEKMEESTEIVNSEEQTLKERAEDAIVSPVLFSQNRVSKLKKAKISKPNKTQKSKKNHKLDSILDSYLKLLSK